MKKICLLILTFIVSQISIAQSKDSLEAKPYILPIVKGEAIGISISYDGSFLVLATNSKDSSFLYEYKRKDGIWLLSGLVLKSSVNISSPFYSPDNNVLYFSIDSGENADIAYITRLSEGWSKIKLLDSLINTPSAQEFDPCLSPMGDLLYFTRKETAEECGYINYAFWRNGWTIDPKKIVAPINLECDLSLSCQYDGKGMFFVSRRNNDKSLDIYYTKRITEDIFLIPERMVFSHSKREEFSPTYDPVNADLVFIRNERGHNKLMYYHLPKQYEPSPVVVKKGKVINKLNNKPVKAVVEVLNPITNTPYSRFITYTGNYQVFLYPNKDYILKFSGEGFSTYFSYDKITDIKETEIEERDVYLFDKVNLVLNIYDEKVFDRVDASFEISDSISGQKLPDIEYKKVDKGKYVFVLPIGRFYTIGINNPDYYPTSFSLDLRGTIIYQNYEKDIDIKPRLQKLVLKVIDAFNQKGIETEVEVVSRTTGKKYKVKVKTDKNGNAVVFLRKGDVYDISITPKGYTFFSQELDLEADSIPQEIVAQVKPLKKDLQMQFHNITFELNSADLKEESYPILDQLVEFLKKNPNIKVEISAHTDDLGSEQYNLKLSLRRANSVVYYLKEHGVPAQQMIPIGYGESRPLVPNDSDEHRSMNRRVEFKILEIK